MQLSGWDDARSYYYRALTSPIGAEKDSYFVKTFLAVGHLMHLLQDMGVPAHTRNDFASHLKFKKVSFSWISNWFGNAFEYYVERRQQDLFSSLVPERPTFSNPNVTDYWDTDQYGVVPGNIPGLAEYVNANYFSDETIPDNAPSIEHTYLLPTVNTGFKCWDRSPGSQTDNTHYVSRVPCPEPGGEVDHFAALSFINKKSDLLNWSKPKPVVLDENVHKTYAKELVPKAVGYSAALLDHFFRGTIELQPVPGAVTRRGISLMARNSTASGDTMPAGELSLVVRYREAHEFVDDDWGRGLGYPTSEYEYRVYTLPTLRSIPRDNAERFDFNLSADPLPLRMTDVTVQLVYKGTLGLELDNAVAVGKVDLQTMDTDIAVSLPVSGVYAIATDNAFRSFVLTAQAAVDGFQLADGLIELEVEYRQAVADPFGSAEVATTPGNAKAYISRVEEMNQVKTLPPGQPVELHFNLSSAPVPMWATDVFVNLIYRSASDPDETKWLGAGRRDISEPTPVHIFNNTDRVCINGLWYPNDTPEEIAAALDAVNNESDVFPHVFTNIFGEISSFADNALASIYRKDMEKPGPQAQGTLLTLGHILTDYSEFSYSLVATWNKLYGEDPWTTSAPATLQTGTGVRNQQEPGGGRTFPIMYRMRNNPMWWGTGLILENPRYPTDSQCDWGAIQ